MADIESRTVTIGIDNVISTSTIGYGLNAGIGSLANDKWWGDDSFTIFNIMCVTDINQSPSSAYTYGISSFNQANAIDAGATMDFKFIFIDGESHVIRLEWKKQAYVRAEYYSYNPENGKALYNKMLECVGQDVVVQPISTLEPPKPPTTKYRYRLLVNGEAESSSTTTGATITKPL